MVLGDAICEYDFELPAMKRIERSERTNFLKSGNIVETDSLILIVVFSPRENYCSILYWRLKLVMCSTRRS